MTRIRRRRTSRGRTPRPALRFTPYAWAKLLYLRDLGPTEVGGFGISAESDPLLIEDLRLVAQVCTAVTVKFDDAAVADHFDECVDAGLPPERFARVWVHTHPGDCPRPSGTDERTFGRVFGGCDWSVMAILARGGASYARLRFAAGPGGDLVLPVDVDFAVPFAAADPAGWAEEYARCVTAETAFPSDPAGGPGRGLRDLAGAEFDPFEPGPSRFVTSDFPVTDPRVWEFHSEHDSGEQDRVSGLEH
ncbi:MAG TPA: hypothetical protein VF170_15410 [Planctomycetaceae bacterium]